MRFLSPKFDWPFAFLMMAVIFIASSLPAQSIPSFGGYDFSIKKGAHAFGYALLTLSYWRALKQPALPYAVLPWLLAVLYAASDEFHQSFTPGRSARWFDVGVDAGGAALGLLICLLWQRQFLRHHPWRHPR